MNEIVLIQAFGALWMHWATHRTISASYWLLDLRISSTMWTRRRSFWCYLSSFWLYLPEYQSRRNISWTFRGMRSASILVYTNGTHFSLIDLLRSQAANKSQKFFKGTELEALPVNDEKDIDQDLDSSEVTLSDFSKWCALHVVVIKLHINYSSLLFHS